MKLKAFFARRKKLVIITAVAVLAVCIGCGIWYYVGHNSSEPVYVYPFDYIGMTEYWGDSQESYGPVTTDKIQTIYLTETQTVTEILVQPGDAVKKGDLLMTFDTTLSDLALERKRLDVEKLKLQLEDAKDELRRINSMKPMVIPDYSDVETEDTNLGTALTDSYRISDWVQYDGSSQGKALVVWLNSATVVDDGLFEAVRLRAEEYQNENARREWESNLAASQNDAVESAMAVQSVEALSAETGEEEPPAGEGGETPPEGGETPPEGGETPPEGGETPPEGGETPPEGGETPPEGGEIPPEGGETPPEGGETPPEGGDTPPEGGETPPEGGETPPEGGETPPEGGETPPEGGETPPVQEPVYVPFTVNSYYVVFKVTEGNMSLGGRAVWQGMKVTGTGSGFVFQLYNAGSMEDYTVTESNVGSSVPEIDFGSGYTAAQIAQMRSEQEKKIKELEFNIKMAEADYKIALTEANDGNVYATIDGEVVSVLTEEEAKQTMQPVLKVSGGGGFYVQGFVSELEKDKLLIGQEVTVNDWNTGMTYTGTISSMGDFPTPDGYWNGMGNPTASFYPFSVFVDGSADLQEGRYVSVMYSTSTAENGIYLENPFIRTENGRSYVFVLGADGRLEQRFVTTGKSLWGSYTEILGGITPEDLIAFPYGKNVKAGAPAVEGDMSNLYG